MNQAVTDVFSTVRGRIQQAPTFVRHGRVASITGLIVESDGPNASVGELCLLRSQRTGFEVLAEVVGFRSEKILLMALGDVSGLHVGCETIAWDSWSLPEANEALFGQILDALGRPLDESRSVTRSKRGLPAQQPPNPLRRRRITEPFPTGVRAIDAFVPVGRDRESAFSQAPGWASPPCWV